MAIENDLFKLSPTEYGNAYQAHLLEQYKLFVESADRISQRRQQANSFFLTLNTALLAVLGGILSRSIQASALWWFLPVAAVGLVLCYVWYRLVLSYKGLNAGKFEAIHAIETKLPLALFDAEWRQIGEGRDSKKYKPFSEIETWIPWVFMSLYGVLVVAVVVQRWCL